MAPDVIPQVKIYTQSDGYYRILENENLAQSVKTVIDCDIEGAESYILKITEKSIMLASSSNEGLFRGWQTLKQLAVLAPDGKIACCRIED